ncbi:MAG: aminotransferase, partial [archaeon]
MKLSKNTAYLKQSPIRQLLKIVSEKDVISFSGGMPSVNTFPKEFMLKHLLGIIEEKGDLALQYGPSEGFNFVREELARFVKRRRKIKTSFENIYITTGSQQMLYL